jgi:DNA-binding NarL/FixJ family response regulator
LLESTDDIDFRGGCESLPEARRMLERERPDVLVIDRGFGMHAVIELLSDLRTDSRPPHVVIWAAAITDMECFHALQAGAHGIMRKTVEPGALFHCLRSVANDELWTENLYDLRDMPLERPRSRPLTPREQQVADLVCKGMKNREIAEVLGIATGTVKIHLMHVFEKTGIRDRFELALHGLRLATAREQDEAEAASEMTRSS